MDEKIMDVMNEHLDDVEVTVMPEVLETVSYDDVKKSGMLKGGLIALGAACVIGIAGYFWKKHKSKEQEENEKGSILDGVNEEDILDVEYEDE